MDNFVIRGGTGLYPESRINKNKYSGLKWPVHLPLPDKINRNE
jgi:hypothetical protein